MPISCKLLSEFAVLGIIVYHHIAGLQLMSLLRALVCMQGVLQVLRNGAQFPDSDSDKRLKDVLRANFDGLSRVAQNIFLDIVSVLHGYRKEEALAVWEAWCNSVGHVGSASAALEELQRQALVTVEVQKVYTRRDQVEVLLVHDVIRSLGCGILCDPHKEFYGSRVWVRADKKLQEFTEVRQSSRCKSSCRAGMVDIAGRPVAGCSAHRP